MISIILPTKNEKRIIATTLEGLSRCTLPKEIIISDGNSTDGTIEIAKKYTDKVVVYKGVTRQNISQGRNAGAHIAQGEYFVFMDADTSIVHPDVFFNTAISLFESNPTLGALTVKIKVLPEAETFGDKVIFGFMNYLHRFYNNVCGIGASTGEFQMMRSSVFKDVGGFNEAFAAGEDYDLFNRISKKYATRMVPSLTVYHTGRRAHTVGWPKLLSQWFMNFFLTTFFKKSSDSWDEVR
jgi:glycosyltransferase involved in cell wall biosynthesis